MGSLESVGGGASFHFSGTQSSPGKANRGEQKGKGGDSTLLSAATSGKVEDSGHVGEEPQL